jgi:hypothetical protein
VLLRFNTFFTVAARPHAEADKKRVLHELAACVRLSCNMAACTPSCTMAPGGPLRAREPQRADSAAAVCRGSRATVRLYAASRQATVLSGPHARTHLHAQYTPAANGPTRCGAPMQCEQRV